MEKVHRIPWWLWVIAAALLIAATAPLPYGYYKFLRIAVCSFAIIVAICSWDSHRTIAQIWTVAFIALAILFNPLAPISMRRAVWFYWDIGAALFVLTHLLAVRIRRSVPV